MSQHRLAQENLIDRPRDRPHTGAQHVTWRHAELMLAWPSGDDHAEMASKEMVTDCAHIIIRTSQPLSATTLSSPCTAYSMNRDQIRFQTHLKDIRSCRAQEQRTARICLATQHTRRHGAAVSIGQGPAIRNAKTSPTVLSPVTAACGPRANPQRWILATPLLRPILLR